MLRKTAVLGICLLLLGVPSRGGEEEGWKPWTGRLPGEDTMNPNGKSAVWAGQVVDGDTGAPVPGCRVRVYSEHGRVVVDGRSTQVGEARSDQDGFVVLGVWREPPPNHWVFEAKGFAPKTVTARSPLPVWEEFETPGTVVRLFRGEDFRGKVVGPLGRPVAGVRISHYDGCRHAPALQRAATDTDGRFLFRGAIVDTLWVEGGGVAGAYASWETGPEGEELISARPGVTVEGRVLDPEGRPLEGIWVRNWARGPAARTGPDGRFALEGADAGCQLGLLTDWMPQKNGVTTMDYAVDVVRDPLPVILHFDPEEGCVPRESLEEVTIRLGGASEGAGVVLIHEATGIPATGVVEEGVVRLRTMPGKHQLRVGSPFGLVWWKPLNVEVKGAGPLALPGTPPEEKRRLLRIRIAGLPSPESGDDLFITASVHTATGEARWVDSLDDPIPVPVDEPLAVHLRAFSQHLGIYRIEPVSGDGEEVVTRTVRPDLSRLLEEESSEPEEDPPEREVKVVVRDDTGRLLPGVRVRIPEEEETSDENGEALFFTSGSVRTIRVSALDLWEHVEAVEGSGPYEIVIPASTVSLMLPVESAGTARLHGRRFGAHPEGGRVWLRGVPAGSHRVVLVLADGRRFERTVDVGERENLVLEAPSAK